MGMVWLGCHGFGLLLLRQWCLAPPPIAIGRGCDFLVIDRGDPPGERYSDEVDVLAHNIWIGG